LEPLIPDIEEKEISCEFVEEGHMYINIINERVLSFREKIGGTGYDTHVEDLSRIYRKKTYQLLAYIDERDEKEFLDHIPNCKAMRWCPEFADIVIADGGKDKGIESLLDYLNISREDCMAFGDGGNDISMLEYVGSGVAMGNANPPVKLIADFVTKDIDDDGIEYALKHFGVL
ncbi:MAG: HAD-IIB family hydrolase, partial [Peptostreptococcus stomatis]